MATMNKSRLLLIRSGIMILAFFGIAFLWLVSDVFLPENRLIKALLGMWSVAVFFLFWDFSIRLGADRSLSSFPSNQHEPGSKRAGVQFEFTKELTVDDDQIFDSATAEIEADPQDRELWAGLFSKADGADAREEAIFIRLRAQRQQRQAEN